MLRKNDDFFDDFVVCLLTKTEILIKTLLKTAFLFSTKRNVNFYRIQFAVRYCFQAYDRVSRPFRRFMPPIKTFAEKLYLNKNVEREMKNKGSIFPYFPLSNSFAQKAHLE